jgi:hypothetical protein
MCALLVALACIAALCTDVWPVLSPLGGRVATGACLFFAILLSLGSVADDVPMPGREEHDR